MYDNEVKHEAMPHQVLLLGGHGKVAQYLTPLLLRRNWAVTSIIRDPAQVPAVQKLEEKVEDGKGQLRVLVRSLEDVKSEAQAKAIIDEVNPDYVVWSAGTSHPRPSRKHVTPPDSN